MARKIKEKSARKNNSEGYLRGGHIDFRRVTL